MSRFRILPEPPPAPSALPVMRHRKRVPGWISCQTVWKLSRFLDTIRYSVPEAIKPSCLRPEHIAILMALWEDLHQGEKRGLSRQQLRARLVVQQTSEENQTTRQNRGTAARPLFATDAAFYAQLANLKELRNLVTTRRGYGRGGPPVIYTISLECAVTQPTIAKLLVEIHDATGQSIEEDVLIRRILGMRLARSSDGSALSKQEIKNAIKWVSEVESPIEINWPFNLRSASEEETWLPWVKRQGDCLIPTARLRFEIDYLKGVAAYVSKLPGAQ